MTAYQKIIDQIVSELKQLENRGDVATYIPELAKADIHKFGMHLIDADGREYGGGDAQQPFSIQSISKVLSLSQAFGIVGDKIWERVKCRTFR